MRLTKSLRRTLPLCLMALMSISCSSPKPAHLPITDRDRMIYEDAGVINQQQEAQHGVAILIKQENIPFGKEVADALDASLTSVLSDFAFFSIIERSNLDSLLREQQLESLNDDGMAQVNIPEADYLITAKVNAARLDPKETTTLDLKIGQMVSKTVYEASTSVDFRFYDKAAGRTILVKNIERTAPGNIDTDRGAEAAGKLSVAAQECAKVFAMELGARYAPPSRVVEVRGNGQVAKVAMGSNYGLAKGVKLEFFEYVDNSDIIAGATREPSPIGYGVVLESELNSAWIEVLNPGNTFVKRGHYVRITSDQSKGLKHQFRESLNL